MEKCTAVVLAAGTGSRMNSAVAKQYLLLQGKPVLWYTLEAFENSGVIEDVILVAGKGEVPYCTGEIVEKYGFQKVSAVIEGGAERYLSVWQALKVLRQRNAGLSDTGGYVFIHDGARPFVTEEIIQAVYGAVREHHACCAGMPVKDTIKLADEQGFAVMTPNRALTWAVQTPQAFENGLIIEAYERLMEQPCNIPVTDDCMVVETMLSHPIKLVEASYENIKITTPSDLKLAESLLRF